MQLSDGRVYAESVASSSLCLNWTANFGRSGGGGFTLKEQSTEQMDGRIEREERYFGATFDSGAQTFADSTHSSSQ